MTGCDGKSSQGCPETPWVIAHRGSSAYAPENTLPAFLLAIEQGATYVEYDLQPTKDGVLVCLHDLTLERTTNVAEVFPSRYRLGLSNGRFVRRWYLEDFSFEELQRLDAGGWFSERYRGTPLASHQDVIESVLGRIGLFIELKTPERYTTNGLDVESTLVTQLAKYGLDGARGVAQTPVLIHSFHGPSLRKLSQLRLDVPMHLLLGRGAHTRATPQALESLREFVTGISPNKTMLLEHPHLALRARAAGLAITPYTFTSSVTGHDFSFEDEIAHFVRTLQVDGFITNNPDHVREEIRCIACSM